MNPIQSTNSALGLAGPSGPGGAGASYAATSRRGPAGAVSAQATAESQRIDRVELSEQARALASAPTPIRESLVNRIRAEIENGTYDIEGKLDHAVNELAKDLVGPFDPLDNVYA